MLRMFPCMLLAAAATAVSAQTTPSVNLRGLITDTANVPVASATVKLEALGLTATTGADGRFALTNGTAVRATEPGDGFARIHGGTLSLSVSGKTEVLVSAFDPEGREVASLRRELAAGSHALALPPMGTGVRFLHVQADGRQSLVKAVAGAGWLRGSEGGQVTAAVAASLAKRAAALYDVLTVTKSGFQKAYVNIANSDSANVNVKMLKEGAPKFSFFVTSMRTLQELAKNEKGFGGDLRFGETGPGAGLRGADKLCATIAEKSMPGSGVKGWRAFLSVTADAGGRQVNAIDRIGAGPWYDRNGRTFATSLADLRSVRPKNSDPTITNDLPNEFGIGNHRPDPNLPQEDNHHTITGSDTTGRLRSATATCKDWTTADGASTNGKPSAGFSWPRNLGGGGFGSMAGAHWMSTWDAPGCAPGIDIDGKSLGGNPGDNFIGSGGGYGGFYCFALNP